MELSTHSLKMYGYILTLIFHFMSSCLKKRQIRNKHYSETTRAIIREHRYKEITLSFAMFVVGILPYNGKRISSNQLTSGYRFLFSFRFDGNMINVNFL